MVFVVCHDIAQPVGCAQQEEGHVVVVEQASLSRDTAESAGPGASTRRLFNDACKHRALTRVSVLIQELSGFFA